MSHGYWSEVEAHAVLEAWRRSGMSMKGYAKQRGFVTQRLRSWRKCLGTLAKSTAPTTPATLLPVRLKTETSRRGEPVTVLLRTGHMRKVAHGFDEDAFARVAALLEGG